MDHPKDDKFPLGGPAEKPLPVAGPISQTLPLRGSPGSTQQKSSPDPSDASSKVAQPPQAGTTFSQGEMVAGRYRIVQFIGQGGMGDVYEAEDLELHEHVALKTVRPEIAADTRSIDRFKREIQLARRVTHSNVCRIFDLGYHRLPTGGEITFLTMELLPGESLAGRLRRMGRIKPEEASPLVAQMAAALAAAHEAGIVHRDFKPGNVMLVPAKGNEAEFRAVVTDFGLARRMATAESFVASLSVAGEVMGTPAYMAPEQVEGKEITSAADIYALGAVMYEMVTGHWPFAGDTPFAVAVKRLTEPAPSPRTHVPDLDPKWEAAILRCLAREPEQRFENVSHVVAALHAETPVTLPDVLARRRRRKRTVLVIAGGLLVALVTAGLARHSWVDQLLRRVRSAGTTLELVGPVKARRSVAILGFKNLSGRADQAWLSTALSEVLANQLQAGGELRSIPGDDIAQMKRDLSVSDIASLSPDLKARIKEDLAPDLIIVGWYSAQGESPNTQIRLNLELQDGAAGDTPTTVEGTGTEENLPLLVSRVANQLLEKLNLRKVSESESSRVRAMLPLDPAAARLYSEAIDKLRNYELASARDLLQRAVGLDRENPAAHSALAEAWYALGYDSRAQEEAKAALELSGTLPPEQRALVMARYHEISSNWDEAVDGYRSLFKVFSDNVEYGLRLAQTQIATGKGKDALATVAVLRKLPSPSGEDPRIDLAAAEAAISLSDYKQAVELTDKCVAKASARGARLLAARAHLEQCDAYGRLGDAAKAKSACESAEVAFADVGDLMGRARSLTRTANILVNQGEAQQALELRKRALQVARQIGSQKDVSGALINLGNQLADQGDLEAAKESYMQALAVSREIDFKKNILDIQNNLGTIYQSLCDFEGAKDVYEQSRRTAEAIGDKASTATAVYNTGSVLYQLGDLAAARSEIETAAATAQKLGLKSNASDWLMTLGDVKVAEGDLSAAEQAYKKARELIRADDDSGLAVNQLVMAALNLEKGQFPEAESMVRQAAGKFQEQGASDNEAAAREVLARALMAQSKVTEAQTEIDRATRLSPRDCGVRLSLAITRARVLAQAKHFAAATQSLETTLAEARTGKLAGVELEAELAKGEIGLLAGNVRAAHAQLHDVEKKAAQKRFLLIARRASRLVGGS